MIKERHNLLLAGLILFLVISVTGCAKANSAETPNSSDKNLSDTETESFLFEYQGITITMHEKADNILTALGESKDYFEAPSCAFQGLDKIYYYSGFELSTYPIDDTDYISAVNFTDDSVSTKEGIYIGSLSEDVIKAYGNDYTGENGSYIYTMGKSKLSFITEDNTVTAITYEAIND
jgi:hypothetical protein